MPENTDRTPTLPVLMGLATMAIDTDHLLAISHRRVT